MSMPNFESHSTEYSVEKALAFARVANVAYCDPNKFSTVMKEWGIAEYQFFEGELCQSAVFATDEAIFVTFRGTDQFGDWLKNIKAWPTSFTIGNVHSGFQDVLQENWPRMRGYLNRLRRAKRIDVGRELMDRGSAVKAAANIREQMKKALQEGRGGRTIWFIGHSLGGACATLAAADWAFASDTREVVSGVYTFGQPRVGDDEFESRYAASIGQRHYRFVNDVDIVPRVPFMSMGYTHVGNLRYIDDSGEIIADAGFWHRLVDMFEGAVEDLVELLTTGDPSVEFTDDHDMRMGYLKRLAAAANVSFKSVSDR